MSLEQYRQARRMSLDLSKPIHIASSVRQTSYQLDGRMIFTDIWHSIEYDFPVPKLDETWLLDEATCEERHALIDGWIDEQIQTVRDSKTRTAKRYNLSRKVDSETERFVAYAEIVEEYQMKRDGYIMSDNPSAIDKADQAQQVQDLVIAKFLDEFGEMTERGPMLDASLLPQCEAPSINILLAETELYMQKVQYETLRRAP